MCLPDAPALLGIAAIVTALARLVAAWRANAAALPSATPSITAKLPTGGGREDRAERRRDV